MRCRRCGGRLLLDHAGDWTCLLCGHVVYGLSPLEIDADKRLSGPRGMRETDGIPAPRRRYVTGRAYAKQARESEAPLSGEAEGLLAG